LHEVTNPVNARRRYQSDVRAAQAAATRRAVVEAAGRLFRARGYAVPIAAIAAEAGVAEETIYRLFGTKATLFKAVVEVLLAGGASRAEVPVGERPATRAIHDERDPARQVARYAATQPGIHRRAGPLLRALRDARAGDPALAKLWTELEEWRFEGQRRLVRLLADQGSLRSDRSFDEATDVFWSLTSLAIHDLLVMERGWSPGRYLDWLTEALVRELVEEGP
jgi:AcrR family transcriptional regulator